MLLINVSEVCIESNIHTYCEIPWSDHSINKLTLNSFIIFLNVENLYLGGEV